MAHAQHREAVLQLSLPYANEEHHYRRENGDQLRFCQRFSLQEKRLLRNVRNDCVQHHGIQVMLPQVVGFDAAFEILLYR